MDDRYSELLRKYWQQLAVAVVAVILTCVLIVWRWYSQNEGETFIFESHGKQVNEEILESKKVNVSIEQNNYYTEEEAADKAIEAQGLTILRTNTGKLCKSSMDGRKHAEDKFLEDDSIDKGKITAIWTKNSPCLRCAERMNRECPPMKVYIGHVYHEKDKEKDDKKRKKEIQKMKQKGFTFVAWELYCNKVGNLKDTRDDIIKNL